MGIDFHNTGYGRKFFDGQLPQLIKSLVKIASELERSNDLKEESLKREGPDTPHS